MNRRNFLKQSNKLAIGAIVTGLNAKAIITSPELMVPSDSIITSIKEVHKDVFLPSLYRSPLASVRKKLKLVQRHVGYGNFNILSFDDMLFIGRNYSKIGKFSKLELEFIESIFYYDPSVHGFYGDRITLSITEKIYKKALYKVPHSGHYVYRGKTLDAYNHMKKDIGDSIILTSGVRSVVKQLKLFVDKLYSVKANLSLASRSIAPPAFTYHSIGDFDIGKKGFGYANFTSRFALTDEFFRMKKLTYIDMRYTVNNKDGVRYEPWHIKTV
ncbi:MAG: D-alanyl-D-alanine carboxypeptidase family protein [Campylobacteraceae bacterium]|nr:D-alanyl-D-alanine carboxypeptidase family protein [Campylobacteraceae bacterium]